MDIRVCMCGNQIFWPGRLVVEMLWFLSAHTHTHIYVLSGSPSQSGRCQLEEFSWLLDSRKKNLRLGWVPWVPWGPGRLFRP